MEAAYDSFSPLLDPRGSWVATVRALRPIRQATADLSTSGQLWLSAREPVIVKLCRRITMPCFDPRLVETAQEGGAPCHSTCHGADTDGNRFSRWALVTAANRLPLMPFAQLATRIGGALAVMVALLWLGQWVRRAKIKVFCRCQ
ncbi:2-hydroxycarboxylate transporter family protein [Mycetohabitans sp. B6]|nr:2-hydroxycarboxylate transporter family protein [Mycetohabitans sp. B6]